MSRLYCVRWAAGGFAGDGVAIAIGSGSGGARGALGKHGSWGGFYNVEQERLEQR